MYARLNLATKPLVSHRRFLLGAALLGLLGSVLFVLLGWQFYNLRKADEDFRAHLGKIEQEMDRLRHQRGDLERFYAMEENHNLQERAKFIDGVIEARSFNWTKMFMDLEHTLPSGVHVLRIEPKLDRSTVSVKFAVGASSQQAKVELLKAFEESKCFAHIELTSEQLPKQASADVLTLEFSAVYTGI
jgi:DNA-directed RNA polymerase subunit H (RpoH/RPB5)